jgi:hypothetical protein
MGGACGTCGEEMKCKRGFMSNAKRRRPLGNLGVDGKVILE